MPIQHKSFDGDRIHVLEYATGSLGYKNSIGVIEPGEYRFSFEEYGRVEFGIVDENGEVEILDASWELDPDDDRVIHGEDTVFQLTKPGQWVRIKCTDYVEFRFDR